MKTAIIIPARYGSTRFPGKPLAMIAGKSMLQRVVDLAHDATKNLRDVQIVVATDDERIAKHCDSIHAKWVMTPVDCPTGTDRVEKAVEHLGAQPDFIINLQGDAPLTPPDFLTALIDSFHAAPTDVVTPVTQLSWEELDRLRENKKTTPFSGTFVAFHPANLNAFWFSKSLIPAMRKEELLRELNSLSPVYRHIGIYGYSREMLKQFTKLPEGKFEALEGLEQLRVLENGHTIRCVPVDYHGRPAMTGIDSPEDVKRAETLLGAA